MTFLSLRKIASWTPLLLLLLASCQIDRPPAPDELRMHLGAEPDNLNPILATDTYSGEILSYLYDSLVKTNLDTLEYEPKMAVSWTAAPDHHTYVFNLRHDIKWHDGVPFTADDIVYSYNVVMGQESPAPILKSAYGSIDGMTKIDDYTVACHLGAADFRGFALCGFFPVIPKHIFEKEGDLQLSPYTRAPVGNGPYIFKQWETGKRVVLERNEKYWDKKPEIRRVEYKFFNASLGVQVLKKGLIDVFNLSAIQWVRQTDSAKFNADFTKFSYPARVFHYIGWNLRKPPFDDKRVRHAMTMLVDRDKINAKILFGLATQVTSSFYQFSPQYNPDIKPLPYDSSAAKKLLSAVGWADTDHDGILDKDGHPFKFTFLISGGSRYAESLATIMKEDFGKVGIDMAIERLEWTALIDKINTREFDAVVMGWGLPAESDPYQIWHSSLADIKNSSNYIGYKNPVADHLIEQARVEFDPVKRNAMYFRFQEIIYDDQPYTFLENPKEMIAVSKRFDNVVVHNAGIDPLEWKVKR